jgi:hypothetical protein
MTKPITSVDCPECRYRITITAIGGDLDLKTEFNRIIKDVRCPCGFTTMEMQPVIAMKCAIVSMPVELYEH